MLKLELDWASEQTPAERANELGFDDENVRVEFDDRPGPTGWPTVTVYAEGESGVVAGPRLWAWLEAVYGADGDTASELASLAESV